MVYDTRNSRIILFGGYTMISTEYIQLSDTWIFDCTTNTWSEQNHTIHPSSRQNFGMVYDPTRQKILLFGGNSDDTWIYNCSTDSWTQTHPDVKPPARTDPAMYFDPINDKVILFGGYSTETDEKYNDIWAYEFSNNTWTEQHPQDESPSPRYGHRVIYDSYNKKGLFFGGRAEEVTNELWLYDYGTNSWEEIDQPQTEKPETRYWHEMVYDTDNNEVIIFGGRESEWISTSIFNDTWIYDPQLNEWEATDPEMAPTRRTSSSSVYDSNNKKMVIFGGTFDIPITESKILNDTWMYNTVNNEWKKISQLESLSDTLSSTLTSSEIPPSSSIIPASSSGFTILILAYILPLLLVMVKRGYNK